MHYESATGVLVMIHQRRESTCIAGLLDWAIEYLLQQGILGGINTTATSTSPRLKFYHFKLTQPTPNCQSDPISKHSKSQAPVPQCTFQRSSSPYQHSWSESHFPLLLKLQVSQDMKAHYNESLVSNILQPKSSSGIQPLGQQQSELRTPLQHSELP